MELKLLRKTEIFSTREDYDLVIKNNFCEPGTMTRTEYANGDILIEHTKEHDWRYIKEKDLWEVKVTGGWLPYPECISPLELSYEKHNRPIDIYKISVVHSLQEMPKEVLTDEAIEILDLYEKLMKLL